jgi:hypothetical protein
MDTKREVYGRLVQCRTGHAFIGEYYAKFVPMERIGCRCGECLQTREHILRECEKYAQYRDLLGDASPELSLPEILGTEKGLQALAKFLEASGAFTKTGQPRRETQPLALEDEDNGEDSEEENEGDGSGEEETEGSDGEDD